MADEEEWVVTERDPLRSRPIDVALWVAGVIGATALAVAVPELVWPWFVALVGTLMLALTWANLNRPPLPVLRVGPAGLAIDASQVLVRWGQVRGARQVIYRNERYLQVEISAPYKLVKMRSKRRRWWGRHVVSFNGQPINFPARSFPVPLDELERQIRGRMPHQPVDGA